MAEVQKEVFPNGLRLVTEAMPAVRSVSVGIWLRVGSRNEREAENGITHFLEHMVFKGTKHRSAEEIARAADSIGGHLDAFTAKEFTSFSIKALDEHVPRAFEILSDLVKNPLVRPEDVSKECRVIQEEIKMVEDTPDDLVHEIFTQSYWGDHPLGRPILGTRQSVGSLDRRSLLSFFHRHYTPNAMLVTAAGHLEHSQVRDLVAREFGDLAAKPERPPGQPPVPSPSIKVRRKKELEQAHICLGAPGYPQAHPKRYACAAMNAVLGGGMSSRLFQNIREKRGLVYAVFSGVSAFRDAGCLSIYAGTATENVRQVVDLVIEEFRGLKSKALTTEELGRAKNYLKGSLLLALESTSSRMSNLARQEMYFGRNVSLDEIAAAVDAVTADVILAISQELFDGSRLALTVLTPEDSLHFSPKDLGC